MADLNTTFRRDGYLIIRALYTHEFMSSIKQVVRELLGSEKEENSSGVRVWLADNLPDDLNRMMGDEKIVPLLKELIGPDIEFLSVKAVFKDKDVSFDTPWHQDWFYWGGAEKISVWIAMDDSSPENGCLRVIPGSHLMEFSNQQPKGIDSFGNRSDVKELEGLPMVDAIMNRGDVLFFSDKTVHSSHPNTIREDRWAFISTYRNGAISDESRVWDSPLVVAGKSVNQRAGPA
jgi:hypothetical protein